LLLLSAYRQVISFRVHLRLGKEVLSRIGPQLVLVCHVVGVLISSLATAQSGTQAGRTAAPVVKIRSIKVIPEKDGPTIEIRSNHPISPVINKLDGPLRLVIDLPNASMSTRRRRIDYRDEGVGGIRLDQFQDNPPIARIVVDLLKSRDFSWDAAGNRLIVRMYTFKATSVRPPTTTSFTPGVQPVAVPLSTGTSGAVLLAGSRVANGSSITAGAETAIVSLSRGGVVHVCSGTTVSVTSSQNGGDLMLGMSTGALETHFSLDASADSILTPDFRIVLAGPGEFHYAVSADPRGNTCIRALPGNKASVIVSELLGDGTYQVKPAEQVVFRSGRLSLLDTTMPESCGCARPPVPVLRTSVIPVSDPDLPTKPSGRPGSVAASTPADNSPSEIKLSLVTPVTTALPATHPSDVHVQVEAPLVFRADTPRPASAIESRHLPMTNSRPPEAVKMAALPPPATQTKPRNRGFFGKIKGFFGALFR
jgi:hypothetical protein